VAERRLPRPAVDRKVALKFLRKLTRKHGRAEELVTDGLRSFGAALKEIGAEDTRVTGRWENNRVENSRQPFRKSKGALLRLQRMHRLQEFAAVHSSVHNHFNTERSLSSHPVHKLNRAAALAERRTLFPIEVPGLCQD
jgi:putative transposase